MNNPWKITAIAVALVMVTALVTGVVASWTGPGGPGRLAPNVESLKAAALRMALAPQSSAQATPSRSTIEACNRQAIDQVAADRTTEVVRDAAIGAVLGAAVGAAGGALADGGKGTGKGAAARSSASTRTASTTRGTATSTRAACARAAIPASAERASPGLVR
jgi:hypothetical protein